MHYSPPGSSVHGILQARMLQQVAIPFSSRDLPDPGIKPMSVMSPALAGGFFTTSATRDALWMPDGNWRLRQHSRTPNTEFSGRVLLGLGTSSVFLLLYPTGNFSASLASSFWIKRNQKRKKEKKKKGKRPISGYSIEVSPVLVFFFFFK